MCCRHDQQEGYDWRCIDETRQTGSSDGNRSVTNTNEMFFSFTYYISIHVLDSLKLGSTGSCNWKIIYEHVCNFCFVKLTGVWNEWLVGGGMSKCLACPTWNTLWIFSENGEMVYITPDMLSTTKEFYDTICREPKIKKVEKEKNKNENLSAQKCR